ncbi:hypothetical protein [Staphylococcus phage vB_StaM_PB50]|nr:hypothetical protein [Staphylococcus phage vB_StaM_PB50]
MILKENEFYYNKDINELFIIGKDENDINDKINKFYYKKLMERNLDYYPSLNDDLYYNRNLRFDLIDSENIYYSNIYNGIRKNLPVEALEFSYVKIKDNEVTLQLETYINRDTQIQFLEDDTISNSLAITMVKDFYEKDLMGYNQYENNLDTLSNLLDKMLKEENVDGNTKIFINGIDIFEPHVYFRKLEDEKEIKKYLVEKNFK